MTHQVLLAARRTWSGNERREGTQHCQVLGVGGLVVPLREKSGKRASRGGGLGVDYKGLSCACRTVIEATARGQSEPQQLERNI